MKLLLLLAALVAPVHAAEQVFPLPLFKDGLYTRYSANAIPDGGLAEALNVLIDQDVDGVVVARNGYAKYNASAIADTKTVRGLWAFDASDGTKYMVAFSSMSFYKTTGDGAWTQITGLTGFSATKNFDCVQAIGKLFCGNSDVVFSWDGTSTATVSGAPLGNLLGRFRNRLLIAGVSGSKARLRGSGELDATDWTLQIPGVSTTPFNIAFGGADDGEDITCLMGAFQDVFIVGKRNSLWGLYGFGRTDFQVREISREVGCIEQRSVREKNNCLYWMSQRGIEKFCGAFIERIGDPIRDKIDTIVATAGNARSALDTTQADFEAGNTTYSGSGSPVSTTISPGNVVASTFSRIDTSVSDWSGANLTYASTVTTSGGEIEGGILFKNTGFENNDIAPTWTSDVSTNSFSWRVETASYGRCTDAGTFGGGGQTHYFVASSCAGSAPFIDSVYMRVLRASDSTVLYSRVHDGWTSTTNCDLFSFDVSTQTVGMKLQIHWPYLSRSLTSIEFSSRNLVNGLVQYGAKSFVNPDVGCGGSNRSVGFDMFEPFYLSYGTATSAGYDVGFATPTWGVFKATTSTPAGTTLSIRTQVSSDGASWDAEIAQNTDSKLTNAKKRHIRYNAYFNTTSASATANIQAIELTAAATAYFASQCRSSSLMSSWGLLSCNLIQSGGGSITLAVTTGATCGNVTNATATWTSQGNNTTISLGTGAYVAYRAFLDFDSSTQAAHGLLALQDCTINWSEGETRPPVASQVYRDRYYLAYTSNTASGSYNDHLLVLDKNDKWTVFDNHPCYSLAFYNRKLYCGSSTDAGRVWLLDQGTDDDGVAIFSKVRTKAFNLGLPESRKKFRRLYLDLEPSPSQSITLTARYTLERSSPTYSLSTVDLNEDPGSILTPRFPFTLTNPVAGRYIQLELESSALNSPWRLFGGRLYYSPLDPE